MDSAINFNIYPRVFVFIVLSSCFKFKFKNIPQTRDENQFTFGVNMREFDKMSLIKKNGVIVFLILLSVLMLISSGCSKNDDNLGTPENPYKILWYPFTCDAKDSPRVLKKVNEYLRKKIGAELEMKYLTNNYEEQIKIIQAGGDKYDICFTSSWCNDYRVGARRGYYLELNDLLKKYGQGILKVVNPVFFKGTAIDGKYYGIPINNIAACQSAILFNKIYLDKYNIDLTGIKTVQDLDPVFKLLQKNEPGLDIFAPWDMYVPNDIDYILSPIMPGAVLFNEDKYKVINQYTVPGYIAQMKRNRDFYQKGYIPSDANMKKRVFDRTGNLFAFESTYVPGGNEDKESLFGYPVESMILVDPPPIGSIGVGGQLLAISTTSERPDIAMKFLNLLNTDKYLRNLIEFGIEDIHYKKIGDNVIKKLPASKNYSTYSFSMGNLYLTYLKEKDPIDKWEQYQEVDKNAIVSPLLGFTFDPYPVRSEISSISNIVEEYRGMRLGTMDVDKTLPKFIKKMKNAGLDKLLSEMQKQLDLWWAKQKKQQ